MVYEKDENFEVELVEASNNAKLGKLTRTAVTITNDDEFNSVMNKLLLMTNANVDGMRVHNETWAQQFRDAMVVNGGDVENATTMDYVMHFLTFGFKVREVFKGNVSRDFDGIFMISSYSLDTQVPHHILFC
jgi:solute carrier family 8 (sodium/calcium exchanger)